MPARAAGSVTCSASRGSCSSRRIAACGGPGMRRCGARITGLRSAVGAGIAVVSGMASRASPGRRSMATPTRSASAERISSRKTTPGMRLIAGSASLLSRALPSIWARSISCPKCANTNSESGIAEPICWRNAALPMRCTRLSGSSPSGRNRKLAWRPSCMAGSTSSRARAAARRPASSPSKQNTTAEVWRNRRCRWLALSAVPSVPVALLMPCWASITTSMYPSTTSTRSSSRLLWRAWYRP